MPTLGTTDASVCTEAPTTERVVDATACSAQAARLGDANVVTVDGVPVTVDGEVVTVGL